MKVWVIEDLAVLNAMIALRRVCPTDTLREAHSMGVSTLPHLNHKRRAWTDLGDLHPVSFEHAHTCNFLEVMALREARAPKLNNPHFYGKSLNSRVTI